MGNIRWTGGTTDWGNVFVDYENGDFHLKAGSVLIDNGTSPSSSFIGDIYGDTRTGTWDIGADEYVVSDTTPPNVTSVSATPDPQGLGENVTITATVMDNAQVDIVLVGITLPGGSEINYTMSNQSTVYTYKYLNYMNGTYHYTIYANDISGNLNNSVTGSLNFIFSQIVA